MTSCAKSTLALLLFGAVSGAASGAYGSGDTCAFTIYNHTACTANPYNHSKGTLAQCCLQCQFDNQCGGFTLHNPDDASGIGACLFSLPGETTTPNFNKPGITCGTRMPLPPPPSPGPPSPAIPLAFDCGIRRLALEYGAKLVAGGVGMAAVQTTLWEALQLGSACGDSPPAPVPPVPPVPSVVGSNDRWISPTGDDNAAGTSVSSAWRTPARAARWLAETPAAHRPPTTVHVGPGTYALAETLVLGPEHSGASAAAPVRWVAGAGAPAVLSGGADLSALSWAPSAAATAGAAANAAADGGATAPAAVWEAHVDAATWPLSAGPMRSLFAADERQWQARWPNGNPETYCARDHHGGNGCVGFAQASNTKTSAMACGTACDLGPARANVYIHSEESGALIATGTMEPYSSDHNFSVATPSEAFHVQPESWGAFKAAAQPPDAPPAAALKSFQLERFDTSITAAFWNTAVPSEMFAGSWSPRAWAHANLTRLHTYQSEYWGSWVFDVAAVGEDEDTDARGKDGTRVKFSRGGFQEARGGSIGGKGGRGIAQDFYVEGAFEELDTGREFYHNASTGMLYWAPNVSSSLLSSNGDGGTVQPTNPNNVSLVAPRLAVLLRVRGSGDAAGGARTLATHMRFEGLEFRHAAPTFMAPYEPTSGGDWAVHRGAAAVVEWAQRVSFDGCVFAALEGNGLLLQHHVRDSVVTHSAFRDIGETPLLLLGSAHGINGTLGTQPWGNELSHLHVHNWGVWGRQAAGYFEGLAGGNNVSFNVFHDGPRAGANFNDGFGGGLTFEGNLLFNVVQDTGEHGSTNSWDRQTMLWRLGGAADGALATRPAARTVARNFVFRNSFRGATSNKWALDKDDGSSNYDERGNVLLYGAVKDRDGQQRLVRDNLFLYPDLMPITDTTNTHVAMAFQVNGYDFDFFVNNTVVTAQGSIYSCTSAFGDAHASNLHSNSFLLLDAGDERFQSGACRTDKTGDWSAWQGEGFDVNSTFASIANGTDLIAMARRWLPSEVLNN